MWGSVTVIGTEKGTGIKSSNSGWACLCLLSTHFLKEGTKSLSFADIGFLSVVQMWNMAECM